MRPVKKSLLHSAKVVLPLGVEPKSPASEASILSIEIRERLLIKTADRLSSQPIQRSQISKV